MRTVGILGASGLIGMQLTRLLSSHPQVSQLRPFSRTHGGRAFSSLHPAFRDLGRLTFTAPEPVALRECDVLFTCVPANEIHGLFGALEKEQAVIDLGCEFRLSAEKYREVHGERHPQPALLRDFASVIPEINPAVCQRHRKLAAQGCVSTSVALAIHPLLTHDLLADTSITVDAKVSSSGAGASSASLGQMHFNRCNGVRPYKLLDEHRHCAELSEFIAECSGTRLDVCINVFSVDLVRGISSAIYVSLKPGTDERTLRKAFVAAYRNSPVVRVLSQTTGSERYPNPKWLTGTGICEIGFRVMPKTGRAVIISAIDNLMKGGASQAVQIFNLLEGCEESTAIPLVPSYP